MGANERIVSTARLIVGVAASGSGKRQIVLARPAVLVAGAMSMTAGEYVSVSSQSATEAADLAREAAELKANPQAGARELAGFSMARAVEPALADRVAAQMMARDVDGTVLADHLWSDGGLGHEAFFAALFGIVDEHLGGDRRAAVGHRVIHGGPRFSQPVAIDGGVLAELEALCLLAPLHQPHNLAAVRAAMAARTGLPQVACFDTAFHHGHADVVTRFARPRAWHDRAVRRYGFHGLS